MTTPSHVVITCQCRRADLPFDAIDPHGCQVPGHGDVPPDPVPRTIMYEFGVDACREILAAQEALIRARAAWVSRGLPGDNAFPMSMDRLVENITYHLNRLREWTAAAKTVAEREPSQ